MIGGFPLRSVWLAWGAAGGLLIAGSAWALVETSRLGAPAELRAEVFRGPGFAEPPALELDHAPLDPEAMARAAGLDPRQPFAVRWSGLAVAEEDGRHLIRVAVDDGVWVSLGGVVLIDALSEVGAFEHSAPHELGPGLHPIEIRYRQAGGEVRLRLAAARPGWREHFAPLRLLPGTEADWSTSRVLQALAYPRRVALAWSLWLLAGIALVMYRLVGLVNGRSPIAALGLHEVLAVVVVGALLLAPGVTVGLHPARGWVADEVPPRDLMLAVDAGFGNGWYHLYPPAQFYGLAAVASPFVLLANAGWLDLNDAAVQTAVHLTGRLLGLTLGLLTLLAVWLLAAAVIEGRGARLASVVLLGSPVFVLYSKTTNVDVPYLFWTVLAMLALVRTIRGEPTPAVHAFLGALAAAAVATKDQAFAFFPGMALVLLVQAWRAAPATVGGPQRALAVAADRAIWTGAAACAVAYACLAGLPWNAPGYLAHVDLIVGQGSAPFRMFPATAAGTVELGVETARLVPAAFGPVPFVLGVLGLGVAVSHPVRFRALLLLTVPVASYLVLFIGVVGYTYDRFLLGPAVVAALFAALGAGWLLSAVTDRRFRAAIAVLGLGMVWAPTLALNWRLVDDSRVAVERWMAEELDDDPLVLGVGTQVYLPDLRRFRHHLEIRTGPRDLLDWGADVVVVNTLYLDRPGRPPADDVRATLEDAGYRIAFERGGDRARTSLQRALAWGTFVHPVYSNVAKVDPHITVWRRDSGSHAPP